MPETVFIDTPQTTEPKPKNWPKIISVAIVGFGFLAAAAYVGYWYGTQQRKNEDAINERKPEDAGVTTPKPQQIEEGVLLFREDKGPSEQMIFKYDPKIAETDIYKTWTGYAEKEWNNAGLSEDGRYLAYTNQDDHFKILDIKTDTTRTVTLYDEKNKTKILPESWSPDGTYLLVQRWVSFASELGVIDTNGGNFRVVRNSEGSGYGCPGTSWSEDSSKLLIWSYGYGNPCNIFLSGLHIADVATDGDIGIETLYDLKTGPESVKMSPSVSAATWIPNSNKILFERNVQNPNSDLLDITDKYAITDLVGNWKDVETVGGISEVWLNDTTFFYIDENGIWSQNFTTGEKEKILEQHMDKSVDRLLEISPNKKYLIFMTSNQDDPMVRRISLNILDLDTKEKKFIAAASDPNKIEYIGWTDLLQ